MVVTELQNVQHVTYEMCCLMIAHWNNLLNYGIFKWIGLYNRSK